MAAPHVAGAVALIWSAAPGADRRHRRDPGRCSTRPRSTPPTWLRRHAAEQQHLRRRPARRARRGRGRAPRPACRRLRHLRLHRPRRRHRLAAAERSRSTTPLPATPYPSTCVISGLSGAISDVNVNLTGLSHTFPADIDMLLVSPGGQNAIFMSDAAGGSPGITSCDLTFDDQAPTPIPTETPACPGAYQPANYGPGDPFPAPAPAPSGNVNLSTFNGGSANGTWSLYVVDDAESDVGNIAGLVAEHHGRRPTSAASPAAAPPPRLRLRLRHLRPPPPPPPPPASAASTAWELADRGSDADQPVRRRSSVRRHERLCRRRLLVHIRDAGHAVQVRSGDECVVDSGADEPGGDHVVRHLLPADEQALRLRRGGPETGVNYNTTAIYDIASNTWSTGAADAGRSQLLRRRLQRSNGGIYVRRRGLQHGHRRLGSGHDVGVRPCREHVVDEGSDPARRRRSRDLGFVPAICCRRRRP